MRSFSKFGLLAPTGESPTRNMPYARVGAMPQPSNQRGGQPRPQGDDGDSSRPHHAITLADLKKQTAMRLALEGKQQQQKGHFIPGYGRQPSGGHAQTRGFNARNMAPADYHRAAPALTPSQITRSHHMPHGMQPSHQHPRVVTSANSSMGIRFHEPKSPTPAAPQKPKNESTPASGTKNQGGRKPKLPHGLTVQELKDMTKARLRAESTENQDYDRALLRGVSGRESAASAFSQPSLNVPSTLSSHPSNSSLSVNGGRESWQSPGLDQAWESTSVASMNSGAGSEYFGSELAYSSTKSAFDEVPCGRSKSSPSYISGPSSFDYAGNRQRSSTMSPRPGLTLSHLHEDRPLAAGVSTIPGFDAAPGTNISRGASPSNLWSSPTNGIAASQLSFNRERTASAPSIPSVPHCTDDPLGRRENSFPAYGSSSLTTTPIPLQSQVMSDVPSDTDLSSVFRSTQQRKTVRPPPGLFPRTTESTEPSTMFESNLDQTWGQPSFLTSQAVEEAALTDSLGSILKLSGAKTTSADENGLFPRIDPVLSDVRSFDDDQSGSFLSHYRGD